MTKPEERQFRLRLLVLLPVYLAYAQLCALAVSAVGWAMTFELTGRAFLSTHLVLAALATVIALALLGMFAPLYRITVGPEGIRPGPVEPIPWDAVRTARVIRRSALSYLELETREHRKHRVPLFVVDLTGFAEAVEQFAGEDHPSARALWEWVEAE
jgi:hypothetical protein